MADSGHAQLHELRKGDPLMATETGTAEAPSWLNDRDWLDGKTEIELSSRHLRA
jgi:hypothetical protein